MGISLTNFEACFFRCETLVGDVAYEAKNRSLSLIHGNGDSSYITFVPCAREPRSRSQHTNMTAQANAVVASYGYTLGTGTNQANVTATATTFATFPAVQVTISRPQTAIFSSILFSVLQNSVAPLRSSTAAPAATRRGTAS
jgi:hypothetical protein